jgi:hypothetical protein
MATGPERDGDSAISRRLVVGGISSSIAMNVRVRLFRGLLSGLSGRLINCASKVRQVHSRLGLRRPSPLPQNGCFLCSNVLDNLSIRIIARISQLTFHRPSSQTSLLDFSSHFRPSLGDYSPVQDLTLPFPSPCLMFLAPACPLANWRKKARI